MTAAATATEKPSKKAKDAFKLSMADARVFKDIVSAISTFLSEAETANFTWSEDGLKLREMDQSRVAMIDLELPKDAFESFEAGGKFPFAVDPRALKAILSRAATGDRLELWVSKERLTVSLGAKTMRSFEICLLPPIQEELTAPRYDIKASQKLGAAEFRTAIQDASLVAENVVLIAKPGELTFDAKGDPGRIGAMVTTYTLDSGDLLSSDVKEAFNSHYRGFFPLTLPPCFGYACNAYAFQFPL